MQKSVGAENRAIPAALCWTGGSFPPCSGPALDGRWCCCPLSHPARSSCSTDRAFRPLHLLTIHTEARDCFNPPSNAFTSSFRDTTRLISLPSVYNTLLGTSAPQSPLISNLNSLLERQTRTIRITYKHTSLLPLWATPCRPLPIQTAGLVTTYVLLFCLCF